MTLATRRIPAVLARIRVDLEVQLSGRASLVLLADVGLVLWSVFAVMTGGAFPQLVYRLSALLPVVLLLPAAASSSLALEREAGNLELVLALPSPLQLFSERIGWLVLGVVAQGAALMFASWWIAGRRFPLLPALLHLVAAAVCAGATTLAWAATIPSPPVVFVASLLSLLALNHWLLYVPIPDSAEHLPRALLPDLESTLDVLGVSGFLLVLTVLLLAHVRRRLKEPMGLL